MKRSFSSLFLGRAAAAGGGGSGGSPPCALAMPAGPSLITSQLANARAVLTDPPRGIPDSLPARVIEQKAGSGGNGADRKSTRLNSSHSQNSYAVFFFKKKKKKSKENK